MRRTEQSLAASGFDALVIQAGSPPTQFLDDQDYPFKVNPHFKAWVPIVDNPRCLLVYSARRAAARCCSTSRMITGTSRPSLPQGAVDRLPSI